MEFSFIQHALPRPEFPGMSLVDGLNLVLTIPRTEGAEAQGLPVLVFLHGGGFGIGSYWWPQYDFSRLVRLSADSGHPLIGINVNYRLGAPGFLTTPELRAAGYKTNNALRDQRTALRWVRDYIKGFGGDPENVTVMGESAGGGTEHPFVIPRITLHCEAFTNLRSIRRISHVFGRAIGKTSNLPWRCASIARTNALTLRRRCG